MDKQIVKILKQALAEDIGRGDVTTNILIPQDKKVRAVILFQESGVICGLEVVKNIFRILDRNISFMTRHKDGDKVKAGVRVATVYGKARAILSAERTALNFLSHLSGIATQTRSSVELTRPFKTKITDTRKTLPNLRLLQKYAVRCGGGYNHRFGLDQMVLIKDNHKEIRLRELGIVGLVKEARKSSGDKKIEIEVENLKEYIETLMARPDIIMLDNMKLSDIKKAVKLRTKDRRFKNIKLEVSGKVSLENIHQIAQAGADMISVGRLTHSPLAIDVSLEIIK